MSELRDPVDILECLLISYLDARFLTILTVL
jgi:hypothetical protein